MAAGSHVTADLAAGALLWTAATIHARFARGTTRAIAGASFITAATRQAALIVPAAAVAAESGIRAACTAKAGGSGLTALVPTDPFVRAAGVPDTRFAIRAAGLKAGPRRGAADRAGDAVFVASAAAPVAGALGWTARASQAPLGAGATGAAAE